MKTREWMVAALLVAAGPAARAGQDPVEEALAAFRSGDSERALELAGQVAESSENYARACYLIGEIRLLKEEHDLALAAFEKVLELRPEALPAMQGLARTYAALGRRDEAEEQARAALERSPRDPGSLRVLGEVLARAGRAEEALPPLEEADREDPANPLGVRALVEVLLTLGRDARALEVAGELVEARPEHPMGHFLQGVALERQGKDEDAIAAYQAALERDEDFLDAHKNLAILCHTLSDTYQDKERDRLALRHYRRYFALGGKDPELKKTYDQLLTFLPGLAK